MDSGILALEIIANILKKFTFDTKSILAARLVCREWCAIIEKDGILRAAVPSYTLRKSFNRCTDPTVVQWLKRIFDPSERHIQFQSNALFLQSIKNEDLSVFDWFIDILSGSHLICDEETIRHILCQIIESGSTRLFYRFINKLGLTKKWFRQHERARAATFESALCCYKQEVVTYLLDTWNLKDAPKRSTIIRNVFLHVAAQGKLCVMQWLRDTHLSFFGKTEFDVGRAMYTALAHANFEVCKWLKQEFHLEADDIPWENDYSFVVAIIHSGNLAMLKWIQKSFFSFDDGLLVNLAANNIIATSVRHGHMDILEWAYKENRRACFRAVSYISAYLQDSCHFADAAEHGHFNIVQWIYTNFTKPTDHMKRAAFHKAVANGHLDIVRWLAEILEPILQIKDIRLAITESASNGQLDILKWLHKQYLLDLDNINYPISEAFLKAATYGRINTLQWLKDTYGIHDTVVVELYSIATYEPSIKTLEWMKQQNLLSTEPPKDIFLCDDDACTPNHLHLAAWFIDTYSMTKDQIPATDRHFLLLQCIECNSMKNLEFFEQASIITVDDIRNDFNLALRSAVALNNERIVRWLIDTFCLTAADITETDYITSQEPYPDNTILYFHSDSKVLESGETAVRTKSALTIAILHTDVDILQYFVDARSSCKQEIQKQKHIFFKRAVTNDHCFAIEWYHNVFGLSTADLELITKMVAAASLELTPHCISYWLTQNATEDCEHRRKRRRRE